jgi:hypothetical protein
MKKKNTHTKIRHIKKMRKKHYLISKIIDKISHLTLADLSFRQTKVKTIQNKNVFTATAFVLLES